MKSSIFQIQKSYLTLWKGLRGWKLFFFYILHYTLFFIVLSYFIFSDFREAEKTFIWTADGMPQYFTRLVYISQTIRNGIQSFLAGEGWTIPLYDFRWGTLKMDRQIEPLQCLAVLWPWDRIDELYNILVIVRYYLIGLSFSFLGFYFKQKPLPIMIGAFSYTFCGFSLFAGVRHAYFMSQMVYLPLLVIGAEKILRKEQPYLFITVVFLAIITDLYFSCMLAILIVIYILIRFFDKYHEDRFYEFKCLVGRMIVGGGIGIALSSIIMFPTLFQMLDTGRIGQDIYGSLWGYGKAYYQMFLTDFLIEPGTIGSWTCLGFSVLAVPAICLLFLHKDIQKRSLRQIFIIFTGMLFFPIVGYIMSGFNTFSNRWCFAYALCISAIIMFETPCFLEVNKDILRLVSTELIIYFMFCYFLIEHRYFKIVPFVLLACCILLFIIFLPFRCQYRRIFLLSAFAVTCISIYYSSFLMYDPTQKNYVAEFTEKSDAYNFYDKSQYMSLYQYQKKEPDENFYRVVGSDISHSAINASFYTDMNGLSYFDSIYYQSYMKWLKEMELSHRGDNIIYYGIEGHSPALTLANVKYYIMTDGKKKVKPYGFKEIAQIENNGRKDIILENEKFLSVGYTYGTYLPNEKYQPLFALAKQDAQIQSVILNEAPKYENIKEASVTTDAYQIPITAIDCDGVSWENGALKVKNENATMTLSFPGDTNRETYLRIVDLDLTAGSSTRRWNLSAETEKTEITAKFSADAYIYSNGMKTQILDLGYTEEGYSTCKITFPQKGTFKLADLQIWCQPMDNYEKYIDALREEVLENVETNWRGLTGNISVSKDKVLCIAIPYDEGWSAYVDGEKVKIYQANTAFMAVELSAGNHQVELRYWTPGLTAGIICSVIGFVSLIVLIIYWRKKKVAQK